MSYPFPGMNPYLENPALWQKVHKRLIVAIADSLSPQLRPKYIVEIEERVYQTTREDALLVGIPDVAVQRQQNTTHLETTNVKVASPPAQAITVTVPMPETVRESYLEVREVTTREVVTVIELLSPKNKRAGEGRRAYEKKRQRVLGSFTNLVEIDLLRDGKPLPILYNDIQSDYRILVSREEHRPKADLYAFNLPNPIPSFSLPLRSEDIEPFIDLQTLLRELYDRASYDLVIDYRQEAVPALKEVNAAWNDNWLRQQQLR
ncbi:MAG: DUF4058 family protein [Scytonema sp. PMC 1069.18]|nr:DUF4058 family protein [Scytonema sp. PMC 1069.18]MEC4880351.1 DUF4058 family protein [Scytonema sp. PMC 1070.18]